MKIPTWFVIGCGLLVLNLVLVVGGSLSRHALAKSLDETSTPSDKQPELPSLPKAEQAPTLPGEATDGLPSVPSLESQSLESPVAPSPNIVSLEEVTNAVAELRAPSDLLAPLDAMMKDSAPPVSEQLSHSYFESMKLRLNTVKHLN